MVDTAEEKKIRERERERKELHLLTTQTNSQTTIYFKNRNIISHIN